MTTGVVHFPFAAPPATGETMPVAPGIYWVRMPLPFKLDHINLWLLEDGSGWTVVDTGINRPNVISAWEQIFTGPMAGRPVTRLIVTHFHPDHIGLAGWMVERVGCPLWITASEIAAAHRVRDEGEADYVRRLSGFYERLGFDADMLRSVAQRGNPYAVSVTPLPAPMRLLADGDTFSVNGRRWQVVVGHGHSPVSIAPNSGY
jgi:glyoxylase-like metal-dependent hydrolase (beta-lactamase superfamily II)